MHAAIICADRPLADADRAGMAWIEAMTGAHGAAVLAIYRGRDRGERRHLRNLGTGLGGGYGPDHDRLAVTELGTDRIRPASEYRTVLPDGQSLRPDTQVVGRGSRLHFLTDSNWYQLAIGDIPG